ncbi:hypothetical protein [Aquimarina megaterium]|nr:hypothetical protein [Aquimarina megaterium]
MDKANINWERSCARGLCHDFAVYAVSKAPITLVKKWLGLPHWKLLKST